jgi:hypothetical protein
MLVHCRSRYFLLLPFLFAPLLAQDPTAGTDADRLKSSESTTQKKKVHKGTSNDRLFYALPNFLTLENSANAPPLTAGQKFRVTARGTFDPVEFVWYGAQAGLSQAQDHDENYGQGMEGFGKRFGVVFADGTIENFFSKAIFPSLLHQDPRYFQSGKGGPLHRTAYAISRLFVTRGDSGTAQFNFSEFLGAGTAATISTYTYHPVDDRKFSDVSKTWATQMAFDALSDVIKEYWPDLRRKLSHSKPDAAAPASGN